MNIGTMVIRAYAWHSIVPGIIVGREIEVYTELDESDSYEICHYIVQWSDGLQTKELYEELDLFLGNPYIENLLHSKEMT